MVHFNPLSTPVFHVLRIANSMPEDFNFVKHVFSLLPAETII